MAKNFGLDDERIGFDQVTWAEWARLVNSIKDNAAMQIRDAQHQLEPSEGDGTADVPNDLDEDRE